jgi:bacterioferritin
MSVTDAPRIILDTERGEIADLLTQAYWMEVETVMNYIAASTSHDDARHLEIKSALTAGVEDEVEHAQRVGRRIQELYGVVLGAGNVSIELEHSLPPGRTGDLATIIETIVAAETAAIRHYAKIRRATARIDQATNAIAIEILRDEQRHLRAFESYRRRYRAER